MEVQDNVVLVGRKYFMRYVMAVLYKLFVDGCRCVVIKACGRRNVYRAVLIADAVKYLAKEVYPVKVSTSTINILDVSTGRRRYLSSIEISLCRIDLYP